MILTILRQQENLTEEIIGKTTSERKAKLVATEGAMDRNGRIFIRWFRPTDGQVGYLNRDGHSPVGIAW